MAHDHGNEYQIKNVHEDGTEELSRWMNREEQVAEAMAVAHEAPGDIHWLRTRNVLCPNCQDREQRIVECTITNTPSSRFSPHDSHYLVAAGLRSPTEVPWWESSYRH
jgi:hypothetical protein